MKKNRNALTAGIFIVVSVILIAAVAVAIRGIARWMEPVRTRMAGFELKTDIGGLNIGDEVRVGGFKVGEIQKIDTIVWDDGREPEIFIQFTLPKKYVVRKNAQLRVDGS